MQTAQAKLPRNDFDSGDLRRVLGDFATGVTVIAQHRDGGPLGMTANAFTSVSLDPPLVLVSIATGARLLNSMVNASRFSISFLSASQEQIARCYGSSKNLPEDVHWTEFEGLPIIAGAASHLGCEVVACHPHGDHVLVVAGVNWISRDGSQPVLTFHRGQFGNLG